MNNILFVEDDFNLGILLRESLINRGFTVEWCKDGEEGLIAFNKGRFSLCILDVMLPVMDGFTLSKKIRSANADIPIIFLTARGQDEDKIKGFESGADDYVTKPFNIQELIMRVHAILRRTEQKTGIIHPVEKIGTLEFDYNKMLLSVNGESRKLSSKEADLLYILLKNKNMLVARSTILEKIWGNDDYFSAKSMDVYISKIRKMLKPEKSIEVLNAYGHGFKLIVNE